ncbi:uncharacterized protein K460DRAFT_405337 [Cucurbitaria berberidis CBS 394.84]|uniref:Uncharacterized protein n=1 Tax=Cucurbitaria berberidis CBS 394.84 TaxID=1168544 RepID=A0A9P4L7K4_9PLEO|nr:uncharacterized protein K460DRAFT_405337 [Cucurbitaria berberidis CBS 394.84]KAF1845060.1 hypothetical protein K460DRAFT_405337 [Cucurbitaria berberidis CBS 394.84]
MALLVNAGLVSADIKPYISTQADYNTECKTCPRSLCPNQLYYAGEEAFNVTCWTRGTKIMGDTLWLKSEAGCYVTQYDVLEYPGDYTTNLDYCGPESEEQDLTVEDATLKYKTECRICPEISCDTVAYLKENTDVELTCWYPEGQVIIDDPYWLKTTNNCYVAQKNLYSKPDITYLDPCGPIPFLEIELHHNANGTSDVNKRAPAPVPATLGTQYLINVTVGEEYAYCRSCPKESCSSKKRYEFNQEIWLQCLTLSNDTWWSETTDFCYVKDSDLWQSPSGDYYNNPLCEKFEGGAPDPDEDGRRR